MQVKTVFLLRTADEVTTDRENGPDLIFSELNQSPLAGLESVLNKVCKPLLSSQKMWGKADNAQSLEFMTEMDKFTGGLQEALKHLVGGIELCKPEEEVSYLSS